MSPPIVLSQLVRDIESKMIDDIDEPLFVVSACNVSVVIISSPHLHCQDVFAIAYNS